MRLCRSYNTTENEIFLNIKKIVLGMLGAQSELRRRSSSRLVDDEYKMIKSVRRFLS